MKYQITQTEIKDMAEIFKNSGMVFAVSHQFQDEKNKSSMSVQTGELN